MMRAGLRILIVDDSAFFRHRVADALKQTSDMEIAGYATDGEEAVQKARELRPDVITMDVQMPVVDGITAVRRIMAECPTRILMLSALTQEGARETLEALEAGAIDFLPKERDVLTDGAISGPFIDHLLSRVRAVGRSQLRLANSDFRAATTRQASRRSSNVQADGIKLLAIGASTGGPVAVQAILSSLPWHFSLPIVVAVHMPAGFTTAYAERLNSISQIEVREAMDLDPLRPGLALIAPGGKQLHVENGVSGPVVRIRRALPGDVYHPSVDQLFLSSARTFGSQVLGLILTGMGSDGLEGSRLLKSSDAQIWSQDKKSCVVYGMPQAVEKAGLSDQVLAVDAIISQLIKQL